MKPNPRTEAHSFNALLQLGLIVSTAIPILFFAILGIASLQLDHTTFLLVIVTSTIIVLLSILIANYVVQRRIKDLILELVEAGREYIRGNRNVHATVRGEDELAMLSTTLNQIFAMQGDRPEKTLHLDERHQVRVYRHAEHIVLQIQRAVPPDDDPLNPSFKVAVALSPDEAATLASELTGK
jgi:nitrogen fixation/metabolism regulation signal transduction histidine kinase